MDDKELVRLTAKDPETGFPLPNEEIQRGRLLAYPQVGCSA